VRTSLNFASIQARCSLASSLQKWHAKCASSSASGESACAVLVSAGRESPGVSLFDAFCLFFEFEDGPWLRVDSGDPVDDGGGSLPEGVELLSASVCREKLLQALSISRYSAWSLSGRSQSILLWSSELGDRIGVEGVDTPDFENKIVSPNVSP
jgi:hypothetical protein